MSAQTTHTLLLIKPVCFSFNEETAADNHYQKNEALFSYQEVQQRALTEFNNFVQLLSEHQIMVHIETDTPSPITPDSIFPNNWISFHENQIVLYPMFAKNRRLERRKDIIEHYVKKGTNILDLSFYEAKKQYLEGTGSMVLDRAHKIAYASISQRTNRDVLEHFCKALEYTSVAFHSMQQVDNQLKPIYHTNVMMCITEQSAIICLEVIKDIKEREKVVQSLEKTGKRIISISEDQVNHFAGNMLQVRNLLDQPYLIMSTQAFTHLTKEQIAVLEQENTILHSDIQTIETYGGGSARCMMCEVFE